MSRTTAAFAGIGLLAIAPFVVVQSLLFLEHVSPWHSQAAELTFVFAGVALGVVGLCLLPIRRLLRVLLVVPYIAFMTAAAWVSALPAVCGYFGDCL